MRKRKLAKSLLRCGNVCHFLFYLPAVLIIERLYTAMGKTISEDEKSKKPWDSNAITPGTPFMELLAKSLRYWVVQKLNNDPGWKQVYHFPHICHLLDCLQVCSSKSSFLTPASPVKANIRLWITFADRGQIKDTTPILATSYMVWYVNKSSYLRMPLTLTPFSQDADLIMLALATHEPYFRVLREDVFSNSGSATACRTCGQEGHFAAQCTALKSEIQKPPPEKKPFIFLDVSVLREYLESELNVTNAPFPFNLEMAIDDWVLLIFFVGNDFLPHLPSLEIREGAIDTLLKIWKDELPRMGGYVTNHGQLVLHRAQIILEGLARREDDIFRKRRECELSQFLVL